MAAVFALQEGREHGDRTVERAKRASDQRDFKIRTGRSHGAFGGKAIGAFNDKVGAG